MGIPPEWRSKAKNTANEVIVEYYESNPLKVPVPIHDVIESRLCDVQVVVSYDSSVFAEGISAFARKEMDIGWIIAVNGNECVERQRFSAAHELAHILLMPNSRKVEYCSDSDEWVERLCDFFAGHILMPEAFVRLYYEKHPIPYLEDIARFFKVSRDVARIQLSFLGLPFERVRRDAISF